jgi:Ca2+-binding EF-hand superfamily protein
MPFPAIALPILAAAAAQGVVTPSTPVVVTGHAWAPFISPMGEPFRAHTPADDTLADWFRQADRNHDGGLTADEMQADAERFFATLDTNHDGEIVPDELVHYEWEVAPDIQVMSRTRPLPGAPRPTAQKSDSEHGDGLGRWRAGASDEDDAILGTAGGLQGAARYGLLNMPEPVAAADTNFDRGISLGEFKEAAAARFQLLDKQRAGKLALQELQAMRPAPPTADGREKRQKNAPDTRVGNPLPPRD